jgi:hypothetical protein
MEELKLFLQEHPHLQTLQNRLEREMDSVPDEYRLMVLAKYMVINLEELEIELRLLELLVRKTI